MISNIKQINHCRKDWKPIELITIFDDNLDNDFFVYPVEMSASLYYQTLSAASVGVEKLPPFNMQMGLIPTFFGSFS